jgi:nucleoside phosphorylase
MQEMTGGLLAIFVGVFAEQWAVEKRIDVLQRAELAGCPVTLGSIGRKPVLVCRTGLGRTRGSAAAEAVLREHVPSAVLSVRMAASVPAEVRSGDIVLCEKTYSWLGDALSPEPPPEADPRLLTMAEQAARGASMRYSLGDVLSLWRAASDRPGSERLMNLGEMAVVDAGGYVVAEAAREKGVPFLAVRVALGRVIDVGSEALSLAADRGHLRPGRVALHYLLRPGKVPGFVRLSAGVKRATNRLSAFIGEFLREWSREP